MSDAPKTTKVYLMVEVNVDTPLDQEDVPDNQEITDEARELLWQCMMNSCDTSEDRGRGLVFHWGRNSIVMDTPKVLPDDINDILFRESIDHLLLHEKLRAAVVMAGKRSSKEQFQDMVDRGVINEKGEVLLGCRGPWNEKEWEDKDE